MRNYFKTRGLWVHAHDGADQSEAIAFGGTDDQILQYIQPQIDLLRSSNPNYQFDYHGPYVLWWKLDQETFLRLINGPQYPFSTFAYQIWNQTRLNANFDSPVASGGDWFYEMTAIEIEGSPRPTWSHGE